MTAETQMLMDKIDKLDDRFEGLNEKIQGVALTVREMNANLITNASQTTELFSRVNGIDKYGCAQGASHKEVEGRLRSVEGDVRELNVKSGLIAGLVGSVSSIFLTWFMGKH